MAVVIKWGKERITIPLPPPDTQIQFIRQALTEYTQLPEGSFKLIHSGAVMKDNAPISAYNIKANSVIFLIGGGSLPPEPSNKTPSKQDHQTEESTISQIRSEVDVVRNTLTPSVNVFLDTILNPDIHAQQTSYPWHRPDPSSEPPSIPVFNREKEHNRLAELLLQSLLRLDAISTEGAWATARAERKVAVNEVQGLLDRLDVGWKARPE